MHFLKPLNCTATKSGGLGFSVALATYYWECGIEVNSLTPSGAFNEHEDGFADWHASRTTMSRMANSSKYRVVAVFLSSTTSSYMTGANLVIDDGRTVL
ncbi:SDR family oxidoreductase [Arenicellales bacterium IMCC56312]